MEFSTTDLPSNKKFGWFFAGVLFIFVGYFANTGRGGHEGYAFAGLAFLVVFVTIVNAELLRPFNVFWMRFGLLLGKVVNPLVMGILFFALFTPLGLFMRLLGRDVLKLRKSPKCSHWIAKENETVSFSFKNQW